MSRVQHSILFPCFYEVNFYYICQGDCVCVFKGTAEKVYRGERLEVRIVRGIWDEEDWDAVRAWAPVTHKGIRLSGSLASYSISPNSCLPAPSVIAQSWCFGPSCVASVNNRDGSKPVFLAWMQKKPWRKPEVSVHAASPSLPGELAGDFRDEIWLWRLGLKHGKIFNILQQREVFFQWRRVSGKQRCSPASCWAVDSTSAKNNVYSKASREPRSEVEFSSSTCSSCIQGCGSWEWTLAVLQSGCGQLQPGTRCALLTWWLSFALSVLVFFFFSKSILPFSLFFSSLCSLMSAGVPVCCAARPQSRMSQEWQSSCHRLTHKPALVWGLKPASGKIVLLKLLLAMCPQPPALCLASSEVLLPFVWFRIKNVSFLAFPYPLSQVIWNRSDLRLVWK